MFKYDQIIHEKNVYNAKHVARARPHLCSKKMLCTSAMDYEKGREGQNDVVEEGCEKRLKFKSQALPWNVGIGFILPTPIISSACSPH